MCPQEYLPKELRNESGLRPAGEVLARSLASRPVQPTPLEAAIQALDWPKLLNLAVEQARTEPAKEKLRALISIDAWAPDLATSRLLQQETQEINPLLDRDALWGPLTELASPAEALEALMRGAVLEVAHLAVIRRWLYAVDSWTQMPRDDLKGDRFKKALALLADPFEPLRILDRVLTPEGEISEKASPKLGVLYSEIRSLKKEIQQVLDHLLKTLSTKGVLQENFSDVRDGRYVLPVKISNQNDVDGIVYEASASRQTVFVEPKEVALLNNKLRQRQNALIQEIFAVLEDTAKRLGPYAGEIDASVAILSHWDSVQAKARLSRHYSGKPINVISEREFRLEQCAHPLLWWSMTPEEIIRNEVEFGQPVFTLLLTGPNTGGKTVLLKTLGLGGICARTGFPFPAIGQPTIPFFDTFFVDVGDPQSIEQHLSSFSGHILRFKLILENVTSQSLVLIDELNSATDPEEGAALGRAFLEVLMERGAMLVATTHDPHLKALAIADKRILNASMAFDEGSRTPTYRMILGVPGRSRALETAERLGLPRNVLDLAKTYLSKEHLEFEQMLSKLENDVKEAARARREAEYLRTEAERMKREWTDKTQASVNDMLDRTRQKLRRILEQAQDEVRSSVRKLDEVKTRRELDQTRGGLNQSFTIAASKIETALEEEAPTLAEVIKVDRPIETETLPGAKLEIGTAVRIPKWKSTGRILEIKGDKIKVAMGSIQMSLSIKDVEALNAQEIAHTASLASFQKPKGRSAVLDRPPTPPPQLDLRGMRFDDAMGSLEHYLDQAFRSGDLAMVTVVHGLGTGALREGARKMLKKLPYIKEYRDGGAGHGGTGATVVEFDRD